MGARFGENWRNGARIRNPGGRCAWGPRGTRPSLGGASRPAPGGALERIRAAPAVSSGSTPPLLVVLAVRLQAGAVGLGKRERGRVVFMRPEIPGSADTPFARPPHPARCWPGTALLPRSWPGSRRAPDRPNPRPLRASTLSWSGRSGSCTGREISYYYSGRLKGGLPVCGGTCVHLPLTLPPPLKNLPFLTAGPQPSSGHHVSAGRKPSRTLPLARFDLPTPARGLGRVHLPPCPTLPATTTSGAVVASSERSMREAPPRPRASLPPTNLTNLTSGSEA